MLRFIFKALGYIEKRGWEYSHERLIHTCWLYVSSPIKISTIVKVSLTIKLSSQFWLQNKIKKKVKLCYKMAWKHILVKKTNVNKIQKQKKLPILDVYWVSFSAQYSWCVIRPSPEYSWGKRGRYIQYGLFLLFQ